MGLFENWPYTNLHELNLDWLLGRMKALGGAVDNYTEQVNELINDIAGLDTATLLQVIDKINEIEQLTLISNNILDYGADGTSYVDNTPYVIDMLTKGVRNIYIPAGNYYFKELTISNMPYIRFYGEGTIYNMLETATGQVWNSWTFDACNIVIIEGLNFSSVDSYDVQGVSGYRTKVGQVRCLNTNRIYFRNNKVAGPYNWYNSPISDGNLAYSMREGIFATFRDYNYLELANNVFTGPYKREFIQAAQTSWPGTGCVWAHHNIYTDRTAGTSEGSAFNTLGGYALFTENTVTSTFTMQANSMFNLLSAYVLIANNVIEGHAGGFFDTCESGSAANEIVICTGNVIGGNTIDTSTIKINAIVTNPNIGLFANNVFKSSTAIRVMNASGIVLPPPNYTYGTHVAGNINIVNNIFISKRTTASLSYSTDGCIYVYSTDLIHLAISHNTIKGFKIVPIIIRCPIKTLEITHNKIDNGYYNSGLTYPAFANCNNELWITKSGETQQPHSVYKTEVILFCNNILTMDKDTPGHNYIMSVGKEYSNTANADYPNPWGTYIIIKDNINVTATVTITSTYTATTPFNSIEDQNIYDMATYTTINQQLADLDSRVTALENPTP